MSRGCSLSFFIGSGMPFGSVCGLPLVKLTDYGVLVAVSSEGRMALQESTFTGILKDPDCKIVKKRLRTGGRLAES